MNAAPLTKSPETGGVIHRLVVDRFRAGSWIRRLRRGIAAKQETQERHKDMDQEPAQAGKIVLRRQRAVNPTVRYDDLVRRRVTLLACRRGGPALEVGTGPCACMAQRLARCGMRVTAVDQDANAVIFAERAAAAPEMKGQLKVRQANACRLPFEDGTYRVVVAFDCLGHARAPERILAEMFRVRSRDGIVLITEYNTKGRRATRHRNFGFEERLAGLLRAHCAWCRRIEHPHHVTYVCDATAGHRRTGRGLAVEAVPMAITN